MRAAILGFSVSLACGGAAPALETPPPTNADAQPEAADESPWLKGQLHLHSNASGDSETPPADVVRWYDAAGYDFIVFTDHNRITEIAGTEHMLVMPGIELTANLESCDPPPEAGMQCLLHVNALFVDPRRVDDLQALALPQTPSRLEHYDHARQAAETLGGLAMLNHPNFHFAADAALVGALSDRGLRLLEIANEAIDSDNDGDATHPSTEALWDEVLSGGHRVYGVADDDAHHYDDAERVRARGEVAHVGDRGFVMVRAAREPAAIRDAIARGDFYASSGVLLRRVDLGAEAFEVEVASGQGRVELVASSDGGRIVARGPGPVLRVPLSDVGGTYVRVTVTDARGRRAWTQPVFLSDLGTPG